MIFVQYFSGLWWIRQCGKKSALLFSYKKFLGGMQYEQKNGRRNQERLCGGRLQGRDAGFIGHSRPAG
jgi:hypothetical protein